MVLIMYMHLKTFLKLFYIFEFFWDFVFIYAVEKLFFLDRGLDLAHIATLLFLWAVMSVLLEIPSGVLADRWSRRKMLILAGIFVAIAYTIWIFSYSFPLFLLGFLFRSLGSTFVSGTLQAYVYDFLKLHHNEKNFEKILGRGEAIRAIGMSIAIVIGGFLSQISFSLTVLCSAIAVLSVSFIAFWFPEIPPSRLVEEVPFWHFLRQTMRYAYTHPLILRVMIFIIFVSGVTMHMEEYNDIYLNFLGYPRPVIGMIVALAFAMQSFGSVWAYKFKGHPWLYMKISALLSIVTLLLMATLHHPLMAVALPVLAGMFGASLVITQGIIQKSSDSHQRATITSLSKMLVDVIPISLVFGLLGQRYGLQFGYGFFALFPVLYFVIDIALRKKYTG